MAILLTCELTLSRNIYFLIIANELVEKPAFQKSVVCSQQPDAYWLFVNLTCIFQSKGRFRKIINGQNWREDLPPRPGRYGK